MDNQDEKKKVLPPSAAAARPGAASSPRGKGAMISRQIRATASSTGEVESSEPGEVEAAAEKEGEEEAASISQPHKTNKTAGRRRQRSSLEEMQKQKKKTPLDVSSIREDMQRTLDDSVQSISNRHLLSTSEGTTCPAQHVHHHSPSSSSSSCAFFQSQNRQHQASPGDHAGEDGSLLIDDNDDDDVSIEMLKAEEKKVPALLSREKIKRKSILSLNASIDMIRFQSSDEEQEEDKDGGGGVGGGGGGGENSNKSPLQPRPANYGDYLKAQKQMALGESQMRRASTTFQPREQDEEKNERRRSLAEAGRLFQSMRVLAAKEEGTGDAAAVESMVYELEKRMQKLDADGHFKDKKTLQAPWYSVPIQRQRWGGEQILPDSNYGTLFFDLFFIGAVYNIQEMILSAQSSDWLRSILYFIGTFGPIFVTWETDVYYHSRYCVVDYAHRLFDVIRFVFITTVVLFIQPMPEMRSPTTSIAPFAMTLAIFMESMMHLLMNVELYYKADGDRVAIQNHTLRKIKKQLIPTSLTYLLASLSAAIFYFVPMIVDKIPGADGGALWSLTDLPLTLTAAGYLLNIFFTLIRKMRATNGSADIRKTFVPNNIDYVIDRYNDWFLLLLGEVVMAMVEITGSKRNYVVASMGALTTILIHTLKFESEPGHAHGHALWRNISNATCFGMLTQVLSSGLISFGMSYKVLLSDGQMGLSGQLCNIFVCVSLAWVLIALELMVMTHKGLTNSWKRLFISDEDGRDVLYWPLVWLTLFKAGLFVFLLTIPLWTSNTNVAVISGVVVVILVAITRILGWALVFREEEIREFVSKTKRKLVSKVSFAGTFSEKNGGGGSSHNGSESRRFYRGESRSIHSGNYNDSEGPSADGNRFSMSGFRKSLKPSSFLKSRAGREPKIDEEPSDADLESAETGSEGTSSLTSLTSQKKRAEVYDEMFDAVVLIDLKGFIVTVNKTALDVFGYKSKDDLVGYNVSMLVGGDDAKHHDAYLEAFHKKGKEQSQIGKQRVLKAKRCDGSEFPCIIGIKLSGNHKYLVGYIRDVTGIPDFGNKNKSTKSLGSVDSSNDDDYDDDNFEVLSRSGRATDTRYKKYLKRALDDKSFDCIVAADHYGVIQGVNETLVRVFGFRSKDELFGENISILMGNDISPEQHDRYLATYRERNVNGNNASTTSRVLAKQRQLYGKRRDGTMFKCIIGVHDIEGVDLMVGYIRNLEELVE